MNILYPMIITALGILAGGFVNFISLWLYHQRGLFKVNNQNQTLSIFKISIGQSNNSEWKRFFSRVVLVYSFYLVSGILLWYLPLPEVDFWWAYVSLIYFGIVFVMDIEFKVVLHQISLVGVVLGLIIGSYLHGIVSTILGGAVGFGIMFAFYQLGVFYIRRKSKTDPELEDEVALGFGDVNLALVMGLFLGWPGVFVGLFFAIMFGGAIGLLFIIIRLLSKSYQPNQAMPYAPFIAITVLILLLFRGFF